MNVIVDGDIAQLINEGFHCLLLLLLAMSRDGLLSCCVHIGKFTNMPFLT